MSDKMMGSFYPNCSSTKRTFSKHQYVNGTFEVVGEDLVFSAKYLFLIKLNSKSFHLPLKGIEKVETMSLNAMPFGVCIFLKNGNEIMVGHMKNKKLAEFINSAIKEIS